MTKSSFFRAFIISLSILACGVAKSQDASNDVAPDPLYEASKTAFEALAEGERKAIQEDLIWTGDYNGMAGGVFGRMTHNGLTSFQKKQSAKQDGILSKTARAALASTTQKEKKSAKFSLILDDTIDATLGIPQAILVTRSQNPNGSSRWQSKDEKITLDTQFFRTQDQDFKAFYERIIDSKVPNRKLTYKFFRDHLFVVTGETEHGKFYRRYVSDGQNVKGFTVAYEKTLAQKFDKIVVAMANSFDPKFSTTDQTNSTGQVKNSDQPLTTTQQVIRPQASNTILGSFVTGFFISDNRILSVVPGSSCPSPTFKGEKLTLEKSSENLKLYGVKPQKLSRKYKIAPKADGSVFILSATERGTASISSGNMISSTSVTATLPLGGASGSPVFAPTGALIGIVHAIPSSQVSVNGILPLAPRPTISARALIEFAGADSFETADEGLEKTYSMSEIMNLTTIVAIECQ